MWWLHVGSRRGMHSAPPLQGHVPRLGHTLSGLQKSASGALLCGRGQRELEGPSDPIFTGSCLCIGKEGDGVGEQGYLQRLDGEHLRSVRLWCLITAEGLRGSSG